MEGLFFGKNFASYICGVGIVFCFFVVICLGGGGGAQGQLHCSFFHALETGRVPYFYMYHAFACSRTDTLIHPYLIHP